MRPGRAPAARADTRAGRDRRRRPASSSPSTSSRRRSRCATTRTSAPRSSTSSCGSRAIGAAGCSCARDPRRLLRPLRGLPVARAALARQPRARRRRCAAPSCGSAIERPGAARGAARRRRADDGARRRRRGRAGGAAAAVHGAARALAAARGTTPALVAYERERRRHGAVARLAEDAFCRLDATQQEVARGILLRLAEVREDGAVERRRRRSTSIESAAGDVRDADRRAAGRQRGSLTVSAGTVEIAHEALLREWPRLRRWIEDDLAGLRIHRALTAAAAEWQRRRRDDGELYRGARSGEALEWRDTPLPGAQPEPSAISWRRPRTRATASANARRRRIRPGVRRRSATTLAAISIVAVVAIGERVRRDGERDAARLALDRRQRCEPDRRRPRPQPRPRACRRCAATTPRGANCRPPGHARRARGGRRARPRRLVRGFVTSARRAPRSLSWRTDGRVRTRPRPTGARSRRSGLRKGPALAAAISADGGRSRAPAQDGSVALSDGREARTPRRRRARPEAVRQRPRLQPRRPPAGDRERPTAPSWSSTSRIAARVRNCAVTATYAMLGRLQPARHGRRQLEPRPHARGSRMSRRGPRASCACPPRRPRRGFSPDGQLVVTAGDDGFAAHLVGAQRTVAARIRADGGVLASARFRADGSGL